MSGPDVPSSPTGREGTHEPVPEGQPAEDASISDVERPEDAMEVVRTRNREILEGLADGLGFSQSADMRRVRAEAVDAYRRGDHEALAEHMGHWHDLAREVVDADDRQPGLDLEKAGIGHMLARAGIWQELGDAGNFWEEMAAATMAAQDLPELSLPLQGHIDRMSVGWQIPSVEGLLEAASDYIGAEEAQELSEWPPDEVLIVVLIRLLQSGVRDAKAFLIEHGLV